jgi:hypothetical protein
MSKKKNKKNMSSFSIKVPKFIDDFFEFIFEIFIYSKESTKSSNGSSSSSSSSSNSSSSESKSENQVVCPRCYGKAYVDLNDIKRLGMEHTWHHAGPCGYCDGTGRVSASKVRFVSPRLGSNVDRP